MTAINVGDVVQLKSGGPLMTVTRVIKASATVETTWFTTTHEAREGSVTAAAVKAIPT